MTLKGNTGEFPLETLLRMLTEMKKTGELTLRSDKGEGALGLAEGRVVAAVFRDEPPIPALGSLWAMERVDFEFTPWSDAPTANLEGELQDNLRKAAEYKQWMTSVRQVIPHDGIRFRLSERAAEQGAVTFTSDRWRVVLAVNGQRDVNALSEHLKVDRDTALTSLAGLVRDGVIETIDTPAEPHPAPTPPPVTFAPPVVEPARAAEPAPAAEIAPAPEPPPPPKVEVVDWTAALVEKRQQQQATSAPAGPSGPEWAPPPPVSDAPTWSAPTAAPGAEQWTPPTAAPEPATSITDMPGPDWTPPAAVQEPQQWTPTESDARWTPPVPREEPAPWKAPESGPEWIAPTPAEERPAPTNDASPAEPAAPFDDRLAALEEAFNPPATEPPAATQPAEPEWTTPTSEWSPAAPAQAWTTPAPEAPPYVAADDPRLSALLAPPPPPVIEPEPAPAPAPAPVAPPQRQMTSSEWAPPPPPEPRAPEKKKGGLFGGLFKREEPAAAATGAPMPDGGPASRAGLLAAFSNALITEYNSGQYGKSKVGDRISSLLMRVDEQADPIDKPLPIVDDRLDVQALERVGLPETQAVPYLALLVSTIYTDAEKQFGKDKAKRGYKAAQDRVFRGDTSALTGLAGKLPKI